MSFTIGDNLTSTNNDITQEFNNTFISEKKGTLIISDDSGDFSTFQTSANNNYVLTTDDTQEYGVKWAVAATSGEVNTASSAGGSSLVLAKSGVDLPFKGLTSGTGIQLTENANDINIACTLQNGLNYLGLWNALTNTPTITSGVGNNGDYYVVSVSGISNIDGISSWSVNDWILFNGTNWQKLDHTNDEIIPSTQVRTVILSGDPTYQTVQDNLNIYHSSGLIEGGVISDNLDGSISVTAGSYYIRTINDDTSNIYAYNHPLTSSVSLTDQSMNYIYLRYNGGSPIIEALTSTLSDTNTNINLGEIWRNGTSLTIDQLDVIGIKNHASLMHQRSVMIMNMVREMGGGAELEAIPATLNFTISDGYFWIGLNRIMVSSFDSSLNQFEYYYKTLTGWNLTLSNVIDNQNYNNTSTGVLTAMNNNRYCVHWVYIFKNVYGTTHKCAVIYGTQQHNNIDTAQQESQPLTLPENIKKFVILVGRLIVQKNGTSFTLVTSAFLPSFNNVPALSALAITYDNTTSLLTATNVQSALDEIDGIVDTKVSSVTATDSSITVAGTAIDPTLSAPKLASTDTVYVSEDLADWNLFDSGTSLQIRKGATTHFALPDTLNDTAVGFSTVGGLYTGSMNLPKGTTAQRNTVPTSGIFRYNTTDNKVEWYDGSAWVQPSTFNDRADPLRIGAGVVTNQGSGSIHIGNISSTNQGLRSVSIGQYAAAISQGSDSVAIGRDAGYQNQGAFCVAIGQNAGRTNQHSQSIVLNGTTQSLNSTQSLSLFIKPIRSATATDKLLYNTTTGEISYQPDTSFDPLSTQAFSLGTGTRTQGTNSIAYGAFTTLTQSTDCISIGRQLTTQTQSVHDISIGTASGATQSGANNIAMGRVAGTSQTGGQNIAIGYYASGVGQSGNCVSIGIYSGFSQQAGAVAVGAFAGGGSSQATNSLALGSYAGSGTCNANCIILNGTGVALNTAGTSRFYVKPIRSASASNKLLYDSTSGEISYQPDPAPVLGYSDIMSLNGSFALDTALVTLPITAITTGTNFTLGTNVLTCQTAGTYLLLFVARYKSPTNGNLRDWGLEAYKNASVLEPTIGYTQVNRSGELLTVPSDSNDLFFGVPITYEIEATLAVNDTIEYKMAFSSTISLTATQRGFLKVIKLS